MRIIQNNSNRSKCCNALTYVENGSNVVKCGECNSPQINLTKENEENEEN